MIIIKYGNAKKLESAKRWKCKCSECGCKVILDKEDIQNYKNYTDSDSDWHRFTKFDWTCPYCETELHYEEYDNRVVIVIILVIVSFFSLIWGALDLAYKYYDSKYNYRIEYTDGDGDHCIDWTNELEKKGPYVIYIDEDGGKKKQDIDMVVITDLKEEE